MARTPTKPPAGRTPARRTPRGTSPPGTPPSGAGKAGRAGPATKAPGAALKGEGWLTGQLLVAMPTMQDPRFARSVICLCAHSDDGAMGIVLNKPLDRLTFDELLKQLDLSPIPPQRRIRLMAGGPVENGRGFVLHTADWATEGSLTVQPGLALTASVDILKAIAGGGGPREGVLALGYAGWGPGQLESEIQQNAWLSVPADERLLFAAAPDTLWREALAKLHIDPALLSGVAGRA